jgi:hypothetical protein
VETRMESQSFSSFSKLLRGKVSLLRLRMSGKLVRLGCIVAVKLAWWCLSAGGFTSPSYRQVKSHLHLHSGSSRVNITSHTSHLPSHTSKTDKAHPMAPRTGDMNKMPVRSGKALVGLGCAVHTVLYSQTRA